MPDYTGRDYMLCGLCLEPAAYRAQRWDEWTKRYVPELLCIQHGPEARRAWAVRGIDELPEFTKWRRALDRKPLPEESTPEQFW